MNNFWLKYKTQVWLLLALLFLTPLVIKTEKKYLFQSDSAELFNPKLLAVNTIPKAIEFIDSVNSVQNINAFDTAIYVNSVSTFVKNRFSFGLAKYSYADNWIAALCSNLFWDHFSAIVSPQDIIKQDVGICSQQTIVFLEILRNKGVNFRAVGLGDQINGPGHFICEVFYNGVWHMFDVSKEPNWEIISEKHYSVEFYKKNQHLFSKIYGNKLNQSIIESCFKEINYGKLNEYPAKKMLFFHQVTLSLVYIIPILFFVLYLFFTLKDKTKS